MNLTIPPTNRPTLPPRPATRPPSLPGVWMQLDPLRQQQLAQQLAELIRRLRLAMTPLEDSDHEQP
jgi:hypothetical protein